MLWCMYILRFEYKRLFSVFVTLIHYSKLALYFILVTFIFKLVFFMSDNFILCFYTFPTASFIVDIKKEAEMNQSGS